MRVNCHCRYTARLTFQKHFQRYFDFAVKNKQRLICASFACLPFKSYLSYVTYVMKACFCSFHTCPLEFQRTAFESTKLMKNQKNRDVIGIRNVLFVKRRSTLFSKMSAISALTTNRFFDFEHEMKRENKYEVPLQFTAALEGC